MEKKIRKVKIVCTMGPATAGVPALVKMIEAGMDVARVNFSHGSLEQHANTVTEIRKAAEICKRPIAIIADLCGPKIRVGEMQEGGVELVNGNSIILDSAYKGKGNKDRIPHTYLPLSQDVRSKDPILFDDGLIQIEVDKVISPTEVKCKVVVGGILKDKKGMNLVGIPLSTPALTEKDKTDLLFALDLGVDYLALSFVRKKEDILTAKELANKRNTPIIAKIEKPEAITNLESILSAADGAMVARGDLGIEAGQEKVPLLQKRIISDIKAFAKPVITATQMLDSMISNPIPTRAEVSDVANAVLDGTDAVMLSGETSVGKYPIQAIRMLDKIITEVEQSEFYQDQKDLRHHESVLEKTFSNAISEATVGLLNTISVQAIAVLSETGKSAALMSAHRPTPPIFCFSKNQEVLNRMALYWGVTPVRENHSLESINQIICQVENSLLKESVVKSGDTIVITCGVPMENVTYQTDILKLWKVR